MFVMGYFYMLSNHVLCKMNGILRYELILSLFGVKVISSDEGAILVMSS